MIDLTNVGKAYGKQTLFTDVSLRISEGDRVGLVGSNGSGKSTLFRIISGEIQPDDGLINKRKNLKVGYVHQEVDRGEDEPLLRSVVDSVTEIKLLREQKKELELQIGAADRTQAERLAKRLGELEDRFTRLGGYGLEADARGMLIGLGFQESDLTRSLSELSGGWLMRVELARVLLSRPDALLLDEPTNHLDLESLLWFENYLRDYPGSLLIVAHDREFLNRTVNRIVDVYAGRVKCYKGNYDRYLQLKKVDMEVATKHFLDQQAKIREIEDFVARNRVRKDRAKQVQSRIKQLEKIERLSVDPREKKVSFRFPQPVRTGKTVISLTDVAKSYDTKSVFESLDFRLERGEKVALVGPNGAGKSTLLKLLAGDFPPDRGQRELGVHVTLDYFAQHQLEALNMNNTVLEEMMTRCGDETLSFIRGILGCFLFSGESVDKPVAALSGGEKSRLALAKMMVRPAALLLMDEPTNHLDITSREILEQSMRDFEGTLCFVSHDRRFIDNLATRVVEVGGGAAESYLGNYSYYQWKKAEQQAQQEELIQPEKKAEAVEDGVATRRDKKRREAELRARRYVLLKPLKEQLDKAEKAIHDLEETIQAYEEAMADPEFYRDADSAREKSLAYKTAKQDLETQMTLWEEIGEQIDAINAGPEPN